MSAMLTGVAGVSAWDVYEQVQRRELSSLTPDELAVLAVGSLRQEMNSGGFDSYFRYGGGDTAPIAVQAVAAMGSPALSTLLTTAIQRLGFDQYPLDHVAREERIDQLGVEFDDLDEAYYALEVSTDLDAQMDVLTSRLA